MSASPFGLVRVCLLQQGGLLELRIGVLGEQILGGLDRRIGVALRLDQRHERLRLASRFRPRDHLRLPALLLFLCRRLLRRILRHQVETGAASSGQSQGPGENHSFHAKKLLRCSLLF